MRRVVAVAVAIGVASVVGSFAACSFDPSVDCSDELAAITMSAQAGTVQSNGSVTVYGSIQFSVAESGAEAGGPELAVRAVYVGGQPVGATSSSFNNRSWSVTLTNDLLTAYAGKGSQARIPVVAYLYGGCVFHLPSSDEPVVQIQATTAQDAGEDGDSPHETDASEGNDGSHESDASEEGDALREGADANEGVDAAVDGE